MIYNGHNYKKFERRKNKKNSKKIKEYFIKKKFKRNIIFYFVVTIKNHRISKNIIFYYLEKILQQILYINNIFGIIDYFNGRYSCFHCT